jgi:hypothetical protein
MAHIVVDGIVSDIQRGSETSGSGSSYQGTGGMQVATVQLTTMRIGNRAAELKSKSMFIVRNGERVIAAGKEKHGVLQIGAARNLSAGTVYHPPIITGWIAAVAALVIGVPFSFIFIGLPFVAMGIYLIIRSLSWKTSVTMVEAAARNAEPLAASVTTA